MVPEISPFMRDFPATPATMVREKATTAITINDV
jgi:hypothetical protein